ncbi:MAG: DoxX family membrane protein [Actinobacteria bacterium]|nr:MAG: DoxX family membrane protein [Actinomycetota bacterium]
MSFIFAVVVAAVFVYAGVAKFATFNNWTFQARALGAPDPAVVLVPLAEIALGVMLVGGWWLMQTIAAGLLLLVSFTVLLLVRLRDPDRLPCSCFGATSQRPMSWLDVLRNVILIALLIAAGLTQ